MSETPVRKLEHIDVCLAENVESETSTLLDQVTPIHMALPEIDFDEIDTSTWFLGKKLQAPIMITGITGGHPDTAVINERIAEAVEETGIAMGVGSQRAAIENPSLAYTYSIARKKAPTAPIIANIGAPQLLKGYTIRDIVKAIEMIDADALAVHLNPGQELFQFEGDKNFRGILEKLRNLVDKLPVIVKETGSGFSKEVIEKLYEIGIRYYDVSGAGGTNWLKVEILRARRRGKKILSEEAEKYFSSWGIPTALSIFETRWTAPRAFIISSGGIRTGIDVAKSILIGADMAGLALPILRLAIKSSEDVVRYINTMKKELTYFMFLTGSKSIADLMRKDFVIGVEIYNWLSQRGIDIKTYKEIRTRYLDERMELNKLRRIKKHSK